MQAVVRRNTLQVLWQRGNLDYPNKDNENFNKYVNSRLKDGEIEIILRDLVEGGRTYEHND